MRKSNRTDNESAKMATSKGVIQGYTGVAAVDCRHQVIVEARAYGTGSEQELLLPTVQALEGVLAQDTLITADAGYHSEVKKAGSQYGPEDFKFDRAEHTCVCPAGQTLYANGGECKIGGYIAIKFRGSEGVCGPCTQRDQCLRTPDTTKTRQVAFFIGKLPAKNMHTERMKQRIDSAQGRALHGRRFATVEPVFANLRHNKQLNRFTLRGQAKVDGQWKLFALVHNIEKLAHHGYTQ